MLTLFNKKKMVPAFFFLLFAVSAQATKLHLNASESINIIDAAYLDIPPGVLLESPAFLNETVIYLDTETMVNLNLHFHEDIELLWNGFALTLPDSDSRWLFINGLCDQVEGVHVFPKPHNWFLAIPDQQCEKTDVNSSLVLTVISITHQRSADRKPNSRHDFSFSLDELGDHFNQLSPGHDVTVIGDSEIFDSMLQPVLFGSPLKRDKAKQLMFLENPGSNSHNGITVFIANLPISQRNLKHTPGGAEMNQVVKNAVSEEALYRSIIRTMSEMEFIPKKISIQQGLKQFQEKVRDHDGLVNVQKIINYIKAIINHYKPDIRNEAMAKAIIQIITAMAEPHDNNDKEKEIEALAEAAGALPGVSSFPVTESSHEMALVIQLINALNNSANKIVVFIFSLCPHLFDELGYRRAKGQIRHQDGAIKPHEVLKLLRQNDDWEARVQAALEQQQPEPHPLPSQRPRPKKPSSQGSLDKKTKP